MQNIVSDLINQSVNQLINQSINQSIHHCYTVIIRNFRHNIFMWRRRYLYIVPLEGVYLTLPSHIISVQVKSRSMLDHGSVGASLKQNKRNLIQTLTLTLNILLPSIVFIIKFKWNSFNIISTRNKLENLKVVVSDYVDILVIAETKIDKSALLHFRTTLGLGLGLR